MASTYVNDLRLNEMATGDASGSWGTVTNTNLELIGEAFSYGTETIGDADSTLTIADGAADAARSFYLKITSSVDLTTTRIVTLGPNTVSKVWMIENATTGSQVITIKQGSGATINVPNGQVKMISTDGAGSGGAVLDLLVDVDLTGTTTLVNLDVSGTALVTGVLTTTAATVFNGGFAANADSTLGTDKKVQFRDAAIYINSSVDGQLDIVADTEIQIAATTVDLNGNLDVSGTLGVTGVLTATSLDISGDIDVDGTTNLDVVDIDGAVDMASTLLVTGVLTTTAATVSNGGGQFNGAINVGVDDTGYDVKFFGATAGAYMLWDESADDLILGGAAGLSVNSAALVTGVLTTTAALCSGAVL
jgi:cytoskeletal protein CcmA (bactofilin family)